MASSREQRRCQVPSCPAELPTDRLYYQRHRICQAHCSAAEVVLDGHAVRWCYFCRMFQPLACFDGCRRNCRVSLQQHNARRRKGQAGSARSPARQTPGKRKTGRKAAAVATGGGGAEGSDGNSAALGRSKARSISSQEQLSGGSTGTTATPSQQQASSGAEGAASGLQPPWCTPSSRRTPPPFRAASEEQPVAPGTQLVDWLAQLCRLEASEHAVSEQPALQHLRQEPVQLPQPPQQPPLYHHHQQQQQVASHIADPGHPAAALNAAQPCASPASSGVAAAALDAGPPPATPATAMWPPQPPPAPCQPSAPSAEPPAHNTLAPALHAMLGSAWLGDADAQTPPEPLAEASLRSLLNLLAEDRAGEEHSFGSAAWLTGERGPAAGACEPPVRPGSGMSLPPASSAEPSSVSGDLAPSLGSWLPPQAGAYSSAACPSSSVFFSAASTLQPTLNQAAPWLPFQHLPPLLQQEASQSSQANRESPMEVAAVVEAAQTPELPAPLSDWPPAPPLLDVALPAQQHQQHAQQGMALAATWPEGSSGGGSPVALSHHQPTATLPSACLDSRRSAAQLAASSPAADTQLEYMSALQGTGGTHCPCCGQRVSLPEAAQSGQQPLGGHAPSLPQLPWQQPPQLTQSAAAAVPTAPPLPPPQQPQQHAGLVGGEQDLAVQSLADDQSRHDRTIQENMLRLSIGLFRVPPELLPVEVQRELAFMASKDRAASGQP